MEPHKAHATSEFVSVAKNGGHTMHHVASSPVTVVRLHRQDKFGIIMQVIIILYDTNFW